MLFIKRLKPVAFECAGEFLGEARDIRDFTGGLGLGSYGTSHQDRKCGASQAFHVPPNYQVQRPATGRSARGRAGADCG
jgi:hypothetical protein